MKLTDEAWAERWAEEHYVGLYDSPPWPHEYGSDDEPTSSLWCASLAQAFGDKWREEMSILDYGCGGARFANFMSKRLAEFMYIGVEPELAVPSAAGLRGRTNLQLCREYFDFDPRLRFGSTGSYYEASALNFVSVILAASIFTHLSFETFERLCEQKFAPAIRRGADFVFSVFLNSSYEEVGCSACHGIEGCWSYVTYTPAMVKELATRLDLHVSRRETFFDGTHEHHILVMRKDSWPPDDGSTSSL